MSSSFYGVDVINIGMNVLTIVRIVHDSYLYGRSLLLCLEVDNIIKEMSTVTINVANKLFESVLGVEYFFLYLAFIVRALVSERDTDTCIDRKSTRLNSSHANISYAVFCLK